MLCRRVCCHRKQEYVKEQPSLFNFQPVTLPPSSEWSFMWCFQQSIPTGPWISSKNSGGWNQTFSSDKAKVIHSRWCDAAETLDHFIHGGESAAHRITTQVVKKKRKLGWRGGGGGRGGRNLKRLWKKKQQRSMEGGSRKERIRISGIGSCDWFILVHAGLYWLSNNSLLCL